MGDTLATFGNQLLDSVVLLIFDHKHNGINSEAKELLVKTEELAEKTLEKQKNLLIQIADYLSEIIQNTDHLFYRNHLKRLAEELN